MFTHPSTASCAILPEGISSLSRMLAAVALFSTSLVASAPASADFMQQTAFANGAEVVTVIRPSEVSMDVYAGGFTGFFNAVQANLTSSPLLSYCIEITQTFTFGTLYNTYSKVPVANAPNSIAGGMGTERATALARMFGDGRFADSFTDRVKSVAMQLAVWEVVYETSRIAGALELKIGVGGFRLASSETAQIVNQVTSYLGFTGTGTLAQFVALTSVAGSQNTGAQDFITVVPVPPSAALLGTGLLFGLWTMRRRRTGA